MNTWQAIAGFFAILVACSVGRLLLKHALSRHARRNGRCEVCISEKQVFMLSAADDGETMLLCSECTNGAMPGYLREYATQRGRLVKL